MPKRWKPPAYRLHKARNCAVVTIDGKNHYLGPYGTKVSKALYDRLVLEWLASGRPVAQFATAIGVSAPNPALAAPSPAVPPGCAVRPAPRQRLDQPRLRAVR